MNFRCTLLTEGQRFQIIEVVLESTNQVLAVYNLIIISEDELFFHPITPHELQMVQIFLFPHCKTQLSCLKFRKCHVYVNVKGMSFPDAK